MYKGLYNLQNNCCMKKVKKTHQGTSCNSPMHSYVCGINLRSERSLVLSDLLFTYNRCTGIRQEGVFFQPKSKYDLMRILSELALIPLALESIGCCMTFPVFCYIHHTAVGFHIQPAVKNWIVGVVWMVKKNQS